MTLKRGTRWTQHGGSPREAGTAMARSCSSGQGTTWSAPQAAQSRGGAPGPTHKENATVREAVNGGTGVGEGNRGAVMLTEVEGFGLARGYADMR
jgi:hypothetical protein